jgi:hypothetical protein
MTVSPGGITLRLPLRHNGRSFREGTEIMLRTREAFDR